MSLINKINDWPFSWLVLNVVEIGEATDIKRHRSENFLQLLTGMWRVKTVEWLIDSDGLNGRLGWTEQTEGLSWIEPAWRLEKTEPAQRLRGTKLARQLGWIDQTDETDSTTQQDWPGSPTRKDSTDSSIQKDWFSWGILSKQWDSDGLNRINELKILTWLHNSGEINQLDDSERVNQLGNSDQTMGLRQIEPTQRLGIIEPIWKDWPNNITQMD